MSPPQGPAGLRAVRARLASRARMLITRSAPYLVLRDLMLRSGRQSALVVREDLARRYLRGTGIEIGALTQPLRLPFGVEVRHVDYADRAQLLRTLGPGLRASGIDPERMVAVDAVEDAGRLDGLATDSVDFVIACHVVEHLEDPIAGLESMLRVTRSGGCVLLMLPDARFTFDRDRARTTVAHLQRDHRDGPEWSRRAHYVEWAAQIEKVPQGSVDARADEFEAEDARHHFHVWELAGFLELLLALPLASEIVHAQTYLGEFAVVLRRSR